MHPKGLGGAWDEDRVLLKMAGHPQPPTCPLSFWEDRLDPAVPYLQTLGSVQPQAAPVRSGLQALYIPCVSLALSWTLTSGRT